MRKLRISSIYRFIKQGKNAFQWTGFLYIWRSLLLSFLALLLFIALKWLYFFTPLYAFICFKTLSYAFICVHTLLYAFIHFHMHSYAFICVHTLSYAFIRFHMLIYTYICFHKFSYAFVHFHTLFYALERFSMFLNAFICFYTLLHALIGRTVRTTSTRSEADSLSNRLLPAEAGKNILFL